MAELRDLLQFNSDVCILICQPCGYAVRKKQLSTHIRKVHPTYIPTLRTIIITVNEWFESQSPRLELEDLPETLSTPIQGLPIYDDGLCCLLAPHHCFYICRSIESMRSHCRTVHRKSQFGRRGRPSQHSQIVEKTSSAPFWKVVRCQRVFIQGALSHFIWLRERKGQQTLSIDTAKEPQDGLFQYIDNLRTQKLQSIHNQILPAVSGEVSPWLERTGWTRHLQGYDRTILNGYITPPNGNDPSYIEIGWRTVREMVQLCEAAVFPAGIFVRMAIQQTDPHQQPTQPLQPYQKTESRNHNVHIWQQIILYFLRTQSEAENDHPTIQFTLSQQKAFTYFRDLCQSYDPPSLSESTSENDSDSDSTTKTAEPPKLNSLHQSCLVFCCSLFQQELRTTEFTSPLINAIAVLGIHQDGWQPATTFSSTLSGIIKIARFMIVRFAILQCPQAPITYLQPFVRKWVIRGSISPLEWILDLRAYAMKIAYSTTAPNTVDWRDNSILYQDLCFSMDNFRSFVQGLYNETARILEQDLLLRTKLGSIGPPIKWDQLYDNSTQSDVGWSFLNDVRNVCLRDTQDIWMWNQIKNHPQLRHDFFPSQNAHQLPTMVQHYFYLVVRFRTKLLLLIHITGGAPARMPELLSVRHQNTAAGETRNLFIENGLVDLVTRYHKGYSSSGKTKIIHRYLPRDVGDLVVRYLWLLLPFIERLEIFYSRTTTLSSFLWPPDPITGKEWDTNRVREALKTESTLSLGQTLNIQNYRHISIAISRRFLSRQYQFPTDDEDDRTNEEDEIDILALQAAHSSRTGAAIYGRHMFERPDEVFYEKQLFRNISQSWHEFLGFQVVRSPFDMGGSDVQMPFQNEFAQTVARRKRAFRTINLDQQLSTLLGSTAIFRFQQRETLTAIMQYKEPVLSIMPTGAGKSLLFLLPASYDRTGTILVVLPLVALRQDLYYRCQKLGIICREWNDRTPVDGAQIVLVTPEATLHEPFQRFLQRIRTTQRLSFVVFDECHMLLSEQGDYRPAFQELYRTIRGQIGLIFLSATLPPSREAEFWHRIYHTEIPHLTFRTSTRRSNIAYSVIHHSRPYEWLQKNLPQEKKCIIFCRTLRTITDLGAKLGFPIYHGRQPNSVRENNLHQFRIGTVSTIIASTSLGAGVDLPDIHTVIHYETPYDLITFTQESGRGGRDGNPCFSIILNPRTDLHLKSAPSQIKEPLTAFISATLCRRTILDSYFDGTLEPQRCQDRESLCDLCQGQKDHQTQPQDLSEKNLNLGPSRTKGVSILQEFISESNSLGFPLSPSVTSEIRDSLEFLHQQNFAQHQIRLSIQQEQLSYDRVEDIFYLFSGLCVLCVGTGIFGIPSSEGTIPQPRHSQSECLHPQRDEYQRLHYQLRTTIRYDPYIACFHCGMPQWICIKWQQTSKGWTQQGHLNCQYPQLLSELGAFLILFRTTLKNQIQYENSLDTESDERSIIRFLGKKRTMGGKDFSALFYHGLGFGTACDRLLELD